MNILQTQISGFLIEADCDNLKANYHSSDPIPDTLLISASGRNSLPSGLKSLVFVEDILLFLHQ